MGRIEGNHNQIATRLHQHYALPFVGTGAQVEFFLTKTIARLQDVTVTVAGVRQKVSDRGTNNDYKVRGHTPGYSGDRNAIKFTVAPALNADILVDVVST